MKGRLLVLSLIICFTALLGTVTVFGQTPPAPRDAGPTVAIWSGRTGAWLGVELADVTPAKVSELKLPGDYGAVVTKVVTGSPAAQAGLKENDVVLEFGGMRVWSVAQLSQRVRETPVGRVVKLTVSRAGREMHFSVKMAARKGSVLFPGYNSPGYNLRMPEIHIPPINIPGERFNFSFPGTTGHLGIEAQDLTPQLASYFKVKQGKGVLVAEVEAGSAAAKAGLKAGDCIIEVDATKVTSVFGLRRALRPAAGHTVTLTIVRDGSEQSLQVDLAPVWMPKPQQEAHNFTGGLEQEIRELQRQVRRTDREERQVETCVQVLSAHVFAPLRPVPVQHMGMDSSNSPDGPYGPASPDAQGCGMGLQGSGK
ncbi:MAG: PDZ domain-containing protein [Terriglobia bacterium]